MADKKPTGEATLALARIAESMKQSLGPASEAVRRIAEVQKVAMGPVARIAEQQARLLGPTKAITDQFKAQTWALNDRGLSREFEEQMERVRAAKEREHRAQLETAAAVKELAASSRAQVRTQWATAIVSAILGALVGSIISWAAGRSDVARGQSGPGGVPSASRDADVAAQRCIPSHVGRP